MSEGLQSAAQPTGFSRWYLSYVLYFSGKSETRGHLIRGKTGKLRDLQGVRSGNFWKVQVKVQYRLFRLRGQGNLCLRGGRKIDKNCPVFFVFSHL